MDKLYMTENGLGYEDYHVYGSLVRLQSVSLKVHVERGPGNKYNFYLTAPQSPIVEAESGFIYDRKGDARRCGKSLIDSLNSLKMGLFEKI